MVKYQYYVISVIDSFINKYDHITDLCDRIYSYHNDLGGQKVFKNQ